MSVVLAAVLAFPANVWAAGSGEAAAQVPVWLCIPFAGLLLCIAVMPLVKGEWWEAHQPLMVGFWIAAMVLPFIAVYGAGKTVETVLECTVNDYLTFIILLFGLFCVSGNITMEGGLCRFAEDQCRSSWLLGHCFQAVSVPQEPVCLWCVL